MYILQRAINSSQPITKRRCVASVILAIICLLTCLQGAHNPAADQSLPLSYVDIAARRTM